VHAYKHSKRDGGPNPGRGEAFKSWLPPRDISTPQAVQNVSWHTARVGRTPPRKQSATTHQRTTMVVPSYLQRHKTAPSKLTHDQPCSAAHTTPVHHGVRGAAPTLTKSMARADRSTATTSKHRYLATKGNSAFPTPQPHCQRFPGWHTEDGEIMTTVCIAGGANMSRECEKQRARSRAGQQGRRAGTRQALEVSHTQVE
jgi:hypothetical protein